MSWWISSLRTRLLRECHIQTRTHSKNSQTLFILSKSVNPSKTEIKKFHRFNIFCLYKYRKTWKKGSGRGRTFLNYFRWHYSPNFSHFRLNLLKLFGKNYFILQGFVESYSKLNSWKNVVISMYSQNQQQANFSQTFCNSANINIPTSETSSISQSLKEHQEEYSPPQSLLNPLFWSNWNNLHDFLV